MERKDLTLEEIVRLEESIEQQERRIRERVACAVLFVDLCGSTQYKDEHPDEREWLARLAVFLATTSRLIGERGRVVKFIGDEVMGVFLGEDAVLDCEHAIDRIVQFVSNSSSQYQYEVKIGVDFGEVTMLEFDLGAGRIINDPQGVIVDRCARIIGRSAAGVVLASEDFANAGRAGRWRKCGQFQAKGIRSVTKVCKLASVDEPGKSFRVGGDGMTADQYRKKIEELEEVIRKLKELRR